jgi:DNA repair protein RadC
MHQPVTQSVLNPCPTKDQNMKSARLQVSNRKDQVATQFQPALLSDAELLSKLLYCGKQNVTGTCQAETLLQKFGGLRGLQIASRQATDQREGLDDRMATRILLARELVRRQLKQSLQRGVSLTSPAMTMEYLQTVLRDRNREIFTCLFLDTRHRVIASEDLFQGSIDGACVYPRIVAERALRLSAAAVIVAHNHPSGVSEPSLADQAITRRLKDALLLLEIRLLDHFVVGDGPPVSMASRGML